MNKFKIVKMFYTADMPQKVFTVFSDTYDFEDRAISVTVGEISCDINADLSDESLWPVDRWLLDNGAEMGEEVYIDHG